MFLFNITDQSLIDGIYFFIQNLIGKASAIPVVVSFEGALRYDSVRNFVCYYYNKGNHQFPYHVEKFLIDYIIFQRNDERQPNPKELGPRYVDNFLKYYDENTDLNIIAFGLNCSEPEDMLASFESIFQEKEVGKNINKVIYLL